MSESVLAQDVAQIKKTLYYGNGTGALVTRVEVVEDRQAEMEQTLKSWKSLAAKFLIGALALAATNVFRIAFDIAQKHFH